MDVVVVGGGFSNFYHSATKHLFFIILPLLSFLFFSFCVFVCSIFVCACVREHVSTCVSVPLPLSPFIRSAALTVLFFFFGFNSFNLSLLYPLIWRHLSFLLPFPCHTTYVPSFTFSYLSPFSSTPLLSLFPTHSPLPFCPARFRPLVGVRRRREAHQNSSVQF